MITPSKTLISILRLALWTSLITAVPLVAVASDATHMHGASDHDSPAKLVKIVRQATEQFRDVNVAIAAGYGPFLGCVSGPDDGAMGVHYVNGALVGDGEIDATKPEALMYEASGNRLRLLGAEFIVDSATWLAHHDGPPVLEGQTFQFVSSPNRYALPAFFELHVWAWRDNPNGAFVDWNHLVSCGGQ